MGHDQGVAGWVVAHREPLIVPDVLQDDRYFAEIPNGVHFPVQSLLCAPLAAKGKIIGALQVLNKTQGNRFDDDDLDILTSFAAQSAVAIENARLYQDLKRERDRIVAVEEDVRRRLARDLHDGPAQLLTAITLNIDVIELMAQREPDRVVPELDCLRPTVQKALRQVRTLLFNLRPVILETQGLVPALKSYVERQREMDELAYHLEVHEFSLRLPPPAEQAIFAIVQEATGNARKHARAHNVWIGVAGQPRRLVVTVRDDGRGFAVDEVTAGYDQRGSLGMLNMQERAEGIGGKLTVRSRAGVGTTIVLTVPLEEVPAAPAEEA
jgi:signal transduction histidine kinase